MRRLLLALVAITALASLSTGSAASMRVWSDDITTVTVGGPDPVATTNEAVAKDSAATLVCDVSAVGVVELSNDAELDDTDLNDTNVTDARQPADPARSIETLRIENIDPGCELGQVSVVVFADANGVDVITRSRGVFTGAASQLFPLDNAVPAASIQRVDVDLVD